MIKHEEELRAQLKANNLLLAEMFVSGSEAVLVSVLCSLTVDGRASQICPVGLSPPDTNQLTLLQPHVH